MSREKTVIVTQSGNQLSGETAREVVREENGYRETLREVTRSFREVSLGQKLDKLNVNNINVTFMSFAKFNILHFFKLYRVINLEISVVKAKIYDVSTVKSSEKEDFIISTANEALNRHSGNFEAAKYVVEALNEKYG